jgi:hypothetical protein
MFNLSLGFAAWLSQECLMVEQTYTSKCHCNTVLIAGLDNIVIAN